MKFETKLDPVYEKIAEILGSTPAQVLFFTSFIVYNFYAGWEFINVISQLAISFTLLLLRGQTVQSLRMENSIERTKKDTKKDLKKSDEVLAKIK